MLPALENIPKTPDQWQHWSFDHRDSHDRIRAAIARSRLRHHRVLGGWNGPLATTIPILGPVYFVAKVYFLIFFCMWLRATVPRYRYDQLMHLGWKVFLPLSLVNIVVTGIIGYFIN